jgi:hydroxymethylglutaryl-CoA lyase
MTKLIECPRDAMQGIEKFIPTALKVEYINALLKVGFDTIDFGSFVSPKAIPQMADTAEVVKRLDMSQAKSKLLAIVGNKRGADEACAYEQIAYLGYPFSISETFQQRNLNSTIAESHERVKEIQSVCLAKGKELVIYISMGFGNPYGDPWNEQVVMYWIDELQGLGIRIFSLADTVGVARAEDVSSIFNSLIPAYPHLEFGAHLHARPDTWKEKLSAAWDAGCRRFDSALGGFGGCPMAQDELVGNMKTENVVEFMRTDQPVVDAQALARAQQVATQVFSPH